MGKMKLIPLVFGFLRWNFTLYFADDGGDGGDPVWHESQDWGSGDDAYSPSDRVKEYGSVAELAKGYDNAADKIKSKGILIPGDKATDDEKTAFSTSLREHLGITPPESADKYSWKAPEGMEDYFADMAAQLGEYHTAGMDDKTVGLVMDQQSNAIRTITAAMQEAQAETAKNSETALKEKWGDDYDTRMAGLQKLKDRFPDAVEQLAGGGMANSQAVLEMMDDVARSIREERPAGGGGKDRQGAQQELDTIKKSDEYKNGRNPKHRATMKRVMELQKTITASK